MFFTKDCAKCETEAVLSDSEDDDDDDDDDSEGDKWWWGVIVKMMVKVKVCMPVFN